MIYLCIVIKIYAYLYIMLVNFTLLQPFFTTNFRKSSKNQLIRTWLYRALYRYIVIHNGNNIYRYTQIVYRYISNTCICTAAEGIKLDVYAQWNACENKKWNNDSLIK